MPIMNKKRKGPMSQLERKSLEERKAKKLAKMLQTIKGRCRFMAAKVERIDYKDVDTLLRLITPQSKVLPRKRTGTSAYWQRQVALAVKRARFMALLPYATN